MLACGRPVAEVGEALRAEQQLAHDQQRPALADDVEGMGETTGLSVGALGRHRGQSSRVNCKFTSK